MTFYLFFYLKDELHILNKFAPMFSDLKSFVAPSSDSHFLKETNATGACVSVIRHAICSYPVLYSALLSRGV